MNSLDSRRAVVQDPARRLRTYGNLGKLSGPIIDVKSVFNLKADGVTDDTAALQRWATFLNTFGGTYMFPPNTTIIFTGNITLTGSGWKIIGNGCTLKFQNGTGVAYPTFGLQCSQASKFAIENLVIDANRANRSGTIVTANIHNFVFIQSSYGIIENCRALNPVMDGFYVDATTETNVATFSHDLAFVKCSTDNSWRQGMSVITSYNVLILDCWWSNAGQNGGQSGGADGLDVEPNGGAYSPSNDNLRIIGGGSIGATGAGLSVIGTGDIYVDKYTSDGTGSPAAASGVSLNSNSVHFGTVLIRNYTATGSLGSGLTGANSLTLDIQRLIFSNISGQNLALYLDLASGYIGRIEADNITPYSNDAAVNFDHATNLIIDSVNFKSVLCSQASTGAACLAIGTNCKVGRGHFQNCTGIAIMDQGSCQIGVITGDSHECGATTAQGFIQTNASGDSIDAVFLTNQVAFHTGSYVIRNAGATANLSRVGYISVPIDPNQLTGFQYSNVYGYNNAPIVGITGTSYTVVKGTEVVEFTGTAACAITLLSLLDSGSPVPKVFFRNRSTAGANVTLNAGSGDTLGDNNVITPGYGAFAIGNVKTRTWEITSEVNPAGNLVYVDTTTNLMSKYAAGQTLPAAVRTFGYASVGDGGGSEFAPGSGTPNGGTIRQDNASNIWVAKASSPVSPQVFGAQDINFWGNGATDSTSALNNYFTYLQNNAVLDANVQGSFNIASGVSFGTGSPLTKTLYIRGNLSLTATAAITSAMLTITGFQFGKWAGLINLTGVGGLIYSTRTCRVGLKIVNSQRAQFEGGVAQAFYYLGVLVLGDSNGNTGLKLGRWRAYECGSGLSGTSGLSGSWSASANTGSSGSLAQRTTLTVGTDVPAGVFSDVAIGSQPIFIMDANNFLYYVYTEASLSASIFPWIDNTLSPGSFTYVFGGGIAILGANNAAISIDLLDATDCGIGLIGGAAYNPTVKSALMQSNCIGICSGYAPGSSASGLNVTASYFDSNTYDVVQCASNGSMPAVLVSEYALSLDKVVSANAPRLTGNTLSPQYTVLQNFVMTVGGMTYQSVPSAQSQNGNDASSSDILTFGQKLTTIKRNSPTFTFNIASPTNSLNRLFGYEYVEVMCFGTGTGQAPSGTVTFTCPTGWTLNGGTINTNLTFTGLTKATKFGCRLNLGTGYTGTDITIVAL